MMRSVSRVSVIAALLAISVAGQGLQRSPGSRPWPPGVQNVSAQSPALSPEEALKTFYMPPGYHVELVASEPLIQDPVAIDWDLEGRLWVVEMPGFMADLRGSNEHDPIGRVVVLEDTNADGAWTSGPYLRTAWSSRDHSRCWIAECSSPSRPTSG